MELFSCPVLGDKPTRLNISFIFPKAIRVCTRRLLYFCQSLNGRHCGTRLLCIHVQHIKKSFGLNISGTVRFFAITAKVPVVVYEKIIQEGMESGEMNVKCALF